MKLQIWHIANPPQKAIKIIVKDIQAAKNLLNALAEYDLFIGEDCKQSLHKRQDAQHLLAKKYSIKSTTLKLYDDYLARQNNGVPYVFMNAQGLQVFNAQDNEWEEWHDEDDFDISELLRNDNTIKFEKWS
jgi:hypothetical protein